MRNVLIIMIHITLCCLQLEGQELFNQPESVEYDVQQQRYLVSNNATGEIVALTEDGEETYFNTDQTSVRGLKIVGSRLYAASAAGVSVVDLATGSTLEVIEISEAVFLNDIDCDNNGHIYVSDYYDHKVYRIFLEDHTYQMFADFGTAMPNGLLLDQDYNRMLVCAWDQAAVIKSFDLTTGNVNTIMYPAFQGLDGASRDSRGNIYISSWGSNAVIRYGPGLQGPPEIVSSGHNGPADIFIRRDINLLAVPNFYEDSVELIDLALEPVILVPEDFAFIQAGIDAAIDRDTVLVADGEYFENINFRGKNITVASYYIIDSDVNHILNTIINGSEPVDADSASCVYIVSGEDATAMLAGFTITGGSGTRWLDPHNFNYYREGGGIITEFSSPQVRFNIIRDNHVTDESDVISTGGGGLRAGDGNPLIRNNVIMNNSSAGYGGGIVLNYATGVLENNVICNNQSGEDYQGGAIWSYAGETTILINNTIVDNTSSGSSGGMVLWDTEMSGSNNILYFNTGFADNVQILVLGDANCELSYSDIETEWTGMGNISDNPLFEDFNYILSPDSPCIDGGDPALEYNDPEYSGNPGWAEYPSLGTIRNDMGAYGGPHRIMFPFFYYTQTDNPNLDSLKPCIYRCFPNPCQLSCSRQDEEISILFHTDNFQDTVLKIYNIKGQLLKRIYPEISGISSSYYAVWRVGERQDKNLPAGIYLCGLETSGSLRDVEKIIIFK
ncbi:MAG: SMP-30/gluconolactonase/LRE family protein [Candidatus Cloacimonetes bacterium]|nr:SMP-30/gluconolactonase/LRE family protein [Candidatus Cloacimonadota bacterium]